MNAFAPLLHEGNSRPRFIKDSPHVGPWLGQGTLWLCGRGVWGCFLVFGPLGFLRGWGTSFRGSGHWQRDLRPALTFPHAPRPPGAPAVGRDHVSLKPPTCPLVPLPYLISPLWGLSSLWLTLSLDLVPWQPPGLSQWLLWRNVSGGGKSRRYYSRSASCCPACSRPHFLITELPWGFGDNFQLLSRGLLRDWLFLGAALLLWQCGMGILTSPGTQPFFSGRNKAGKQIFLFLYFNPTCCLFVIFSVRLWLWSMYFLCISSHIYYIIWLWHWWASHFRQTLRLSEFFKGTIWKLSWSQISKGHTSIGRV